MSTYTAQKTYTLKFTIGQNYSEGPSDMDARQDLDRVMGPDSATVQDLVKAEIEKKIEQACGMIQGSVRVTFDSLVEA